MITYQKLFATWLYLNYNRMYSNSNILQQYWYNNHIVLTQFDVNGIYLNRTHLKAHS